MTGLTRRTALMSGVAAPFLATLPVVSPASAAAPALGASMPTHYRFPLGAMEVTTVLAGSGAMQDIHATFGLNASADEFAAQARAYFLSDSEGRNGYAPTVVNTGEMVLLFDTGLDGTATAAALGGAGIDPASIDVVVLTHMHGDHIGGLMTQGAPTFPNARYVMGRAEFDYWATTGNERFESHVRPLADRTAFIAGGHEVAPGITAIETFGHTPGHLSFRVESQGRVLMILGDVANHYAFSLAKPDWHVRFDMDKDKGAQTRRAILTRLAEERIPFVGYHMPFPAVGFVGAEGEDFRFFPATYQFLLGQSSD